MQIYSEFVEGDRKATITRLQRSEWVREMDVWEVAMYVNGRPLQRTTARSAAEAQYVAEDFINGLGTAGPSLLNEHVSNG
mgnify:CR=1 FL=1